MAKRLTPARRIARLHRMGKLPLVLRGREWGLRDLRIVLECLAACAEDGRTKASQQICEKLDWRQPNGWLKERACRDVLRRLERMGLACLPKPLIKTVVRRRPKLVHRGLARVHDLKTPVTVFPHSIRFELAKGNEAEQLWNYVIDQFHYLGYNVAVGRALKYLVWSGDRLLAAISFSSSVWRLAPRDRVAALLGLSVPELKDRVINNSRFLILPCVEVEHLASHILAAAADRVADDWTWYYSIRPLLAETFVLSTRYEGTCYRAANWVEIGTTQGYAKKGSTHHNSQSPKQIFLYGLTKSLRVRLARIAPSNS